MAQTPPTDAVPRAAVEMHAAQRFLNRDPDGMQMAVLGRDDAAKQAVFKALVCDDASVQRAMLDHMPVVRDGRRMVASWLPDPRPDQAWSDAVDESGMRNAGIVFAFVGNAADGAATRDQLQATVDERSQNSGSDHPVIADAFVTVRPTRQDERHAAGDDGDDGDGAAAANAGRSVRFVIHGRGVTVTDVELRVHVSRLTPVRWPRAEISGSRGTTPGAALQESVVAQDPEAGAPAAPLGPLHVPGAAPSLPLALVSVTTSGQSFVPSTEGASDDSGSSGGAMPTA